MIPDYQTLMLPLLQATADGKIHKFREMVEVLAMEFKVEESQRKELLPSGVQPIFDNRVGWANTYLKKAGLLESPKRGSIRITELGSGVLAKNPESISVSFLEQFEDFVEFRKLRRNKKTTTANNTLTNDKNPEEQLELAFSTLNDELAAEILAKAKVCSPGFFEELVIDVLIKMGYGGSRKNAGQALGKSGDGGIDGIITEDKLGLDVIYIQAKKWDSSIPIREIRDFAGSLLGQKAKKGIFITTGYFPKTAQEFVNSIEPKVILIDGERLARLMIENSVGVTMVRSFDVKRLDLDYFEEG